MVCYLKREPILVLSLLRFSKMTYELITFNHLRHHSSSTALGTRTSYWKPTRRGTDENPQNLMRKQQILVSVLVYVPWSITYHKVKPSISTHSKPCTTHRTRLLKCFLLITLCCKTKHLRSHVRGIVWGFEWVEILGCSIYACL